MSSASSGEIPIVSNAAFSPPESTPRTWRSKLVLWIAGSVITLLVVAIVVQVYLRHFNTAKTSLVDDPQLKLAAIDEEITKINQRLANPMTPHETMLELVKRKAELFAERDQIVMMMNIGDVVVPLQKKIADYSIAPLIALGVCTLTMPIWYKMARRKERIKHCENNPPQQGAEEACRLWQVGYQKIDPRYLKVIKYLCFVR